MVSILIIVVFKLSWYQFLVRPTLAPTIVLFHISTNSCFFKLYQTKSRVRDIKRNVFVRWIMQIFFRSGPHAKFEKFWTGFFKNQYFPVRNLIVKTFFLYIFAKRLLKNVFYIGNKIGSY